MTRAPEPATMVARMNPLLHFVGGDLGDSGI
jgi:hypothetical protein